MGVKLSANFGNIVKNIEQKVHSDYVYFLHDCMNNLRTLSPVDTGRYRNAHHYSIGSPSYAEKGSQTINIQVGDFPTVYIQNNLPYCQRLEHGHSKQAPTGVYGNAFHAALANLG